MPAPLSGQVTVTGTAQPLAQANSPAVTAFTVKAPTSNIVNVYIGDKNVTTSTGHVLEAGDQIEYAANDQLQYGKLQLKVSDFYVVGTTGIVSWFASP